MNYLSPKEKAAHESFTAAKAKEMLRKCVQHLCWSLSEKAIDDTGMECCLGKGVTWFSIAKDTSVFD
jgi:hypothetical protein